MRAVYDRLKINAELALLFTDSPVRLAPNHLVICGSLGRRHRRRACRDRPTSILVPLPGAIDQTSSPTPAVLSQAGGLCGSCKPGPRRTGWPRKSPRLPPSLRG